MILQGLNLLKDLFGVSDLTGMPLHKIIDLTILYMTPVYEIPEDAGLVIHNGKIEGVCVIR